MPQPPSTLPSPDPDYSSAGEILQNAQPNDYTFALSDAGKSIFHDTANANTYTIPPNAVVGYRIGTAITIINNTGAGTLTLTTTDTLRRGDGTAGTGSRTIGPDSVCTIIKTKSSNAIPPVAEWMITGRFT
jgi:hypothetical protein